MSGNGLNVTFPKTTLMAKVVLKLRGKLIERPGRNLLKIKPQVKLSASAHGVLELYHASRVFWAF